MSSFVVFACLLAVASSAFSQGDDAFHDQADNTKELVDEETYVDIGEAMPSGKSASTGKTSKASNSGPDPFANEFGYGQFPGFFGFPSAARAKVYSFGYSPYVFQGEPFAFGYNPYAFFQNPWNTYPDSISAAPIFKLKKTTVTPPPHSTKKPTP